MREIKFRAFDGKIMHEVYAIYPLTAPTESGKIFCRVYDNVTDHILFAEAIMQYTGLKDKNGKEIYEGDIVNHKKWFRVGEYKPCKGVVKYKGTSFTCECIGDWLGSNAELNSLAEVIGNIYQNPELLNQ